jgi:hypothetical protein
MNAKLVKLSILMAVLVLFASGCGLIPWRGSGNIISETRPVSGFTAVELSGAGEATIIQDGSESITIETDDDVMQYVTSEVRGGVLYVGLEFNGLRSILPTHLNVTVHVADLEAITTSGAWKLQAESLETESLRTLISGTGSISIDSLAATRLESNISGAGEMEVAGQVTEQSVSISGTGQYKAGDLKCESVAISISGAGDATVWVSQSLDASVSGTGHVSYYGSPQVTFDQSGAGDIQGLGEK